MSSASERLTAIIFISAGCEIDLVSLIMLMTACRQEKIEHSSRDQLALGLIYELSRRASLVNLSIALIADDSANYCPTE